MTITVRYFASVRENLGRETDQIDAVGVLTVADVWQRAASAPPPPRLLAAINREHAGLEAPVKDGDEVAFFPPVTGG